MKYSVYKKNDETLSSSTWTPISVSSLDNLPEVECVGINNSLIGAYKFSSISAPSELVAAIKNDKLTYKQLVPYIPVVWPQYELVTPQKLPFSSSQTLIIHPDKNKCYIESNKLKLRCVTQLPKLLKRNQKFLWKIKLTTVEIIFSIFRISISIEKNVDDGIKEQIFEQNKHHDWSMGIVTDDIKYLYFRLKNGETFKTQNICPLYNFQFKANKLNGTWTAQVISTDSNPLTYIKILVGDRSFFVENNYSFQTENNFKYYESFDQCLSLLHGSNKAEIHWEENQFIFVKDSDVSKQLIALHVALRCIQKMIFFAIDADAVVVFPSTFYASKLLSNKESSHKDSNKIFQTLCPLLHSIKDEDTWLYLIRSFGINFIKPWHKNLRINNKIIGKIVPKDVSNETISFLSQVKSIGQTWIKSTIPTNGIPIDNIIINSHIRKEIMNLPFDQFQNITDIITDLSYVNVGTNVYTPVIPSNYFPLKNEILNHLPKLQKIDNDALIVYVEIEKLNDQMIIKNLHEIPYELKCNKDAILLIRGLYDAPILANNSILKSHITSYQKRHLTTNHALALSNSFETYDSKLMLSEHDESMLPLGNISNDVDLLNDINSMLKVYHQDNKCVVLQNEI